jgi:membrane protease YdiL (CAAX protease family)
MPNPTTAQPTTAQTTKGLLLAGAPCLLSRPGWKDMIVAAVAYSALLGAGILWIWAIPDEQSAFRGIVSFIVSGGAGIGALVVVLASRRIRDIRVFGIRRVRPRWLLIGAALGIGVYILNVGVASVYALVLGNDSPQADYQAAASGGTLALIVTLLAGALLTPLGEEVMFRGIIANGLNRYGIWAGVILSAALFAVVHGISIILPIAFVVGVLCAILFRATGSIWPGFVVHAVYNGVTSVVSLAVSAG